MEMAMRIRMIITMLLLMATVVVSAHGDMNLSPVTSLKARPTEAHPCMHSGERLMRIRGEGDENKSRNKQ